MCGLCGIYDHTGTSAESALTRMSAAIVHRGPDDAGTWTGNHLSLAHRRLSIVDLSPAGHQPMASPSGRWQLVYNGEIYNAESLRKACGEVAWRGSSDTEVLLACLDRFGMQDSVQRLIGMFAFAAYDRQQNQLWLVRDRLGIKPLYYGWSGSRFLFASDMHAISASGAPLTINPAAVASFLRHGYIPGPGSIHEQISKQPPGTLVRLDLNRIRPGDAPEITPYWRLQDHAGQNERLNEGPLGEGSAQHHLHDLLRTAVRDRMIADVPLGAFLSGGFDSSLVCALMQEQSSQPVRTFTIGFNNPVYNEAQHAKLVAEHLGTDHTELYINEQDMLDAVSRLPELCDEPFADSSILPTFLVSQLARRHVTVALSGDGGDELFWGYHRYATAEQIWRQLRRAPAPLRRMSAWAFQHPATQRLTRRLPAPAWGGRKGTLNQKLRVAGELLSASTQQQLYEDLLSHWKRPAEICRDGRELTTPFNQPDHWTAAYPFTQRMALQDTLAYLPDDILTKVDRASMLVSLEARVPLLDHRVVEYVSQLPAALRTRPSQPKYLLKKILNTYVPSDITDRPKMGFGVPLDAWLRGPLKDWAQTLLDPDRIRADGLLDPDPVQQLWRDHQQGHANNAARLWNVIMLQAWLAHQSTSA